MSNNRNCKQTCRRGTLSCCLCGKLFSGGFASCGFSGCLFCSGHVCLWTVPISISLWSKSRMVQVFIYNKCDSELTQLLSWVDWLIVTSVSIRYTGTCQACEMYLPGVTIHLTDNCSNFPLIFVLYPQVKPVFSGSIWSLRLDSKNRNDVTYFLKIETYVILMVWFFFQLISLYYCYTFSNNWFSWKIKRNKLEVYFWWNKNKIPMYR